jgi:hypothetical protein
MRTERYFSSSGLLEMLPIYQRLVDHIGSIWFNTGYGDPVHTPVLNGTPVNTLQT